MTENMKPIIKPGERPSLRYAGYAADEWMKEGDKALDALAAMQHDLGKKYARTKIKSLGLRGKNAKIAGAAYGELLRELAQERKIQSPIAGRAKTRAAIIAALDHVNRNAG